jgi:LPS export ABC transporter permease LptF/LPS export ABC transporter permease LptG
MRIIDRYVIRQVLVPFGIGLLVFTFIFIIGTLMEYVEPLVAKGVSARLLVTVLATLIPQALALSIPMALLLGLLVAFGRLSGDREFVALQACGISLRRMMRPVGLLSLVAWAATSYVMLVAVPYSNQTFREVTFRIIAARAEGEVKPRVFFDDFTHLVLYVRDVPAAGGGWNGVFMADSRPDVPEAVYVARHGRVQIDRAARTVEVVLEDGARHTLTDDGYQVFRFEQLLLRVDPSTVFPSGGPLKGDNEMTVAELRQRIAENEALGARTHSQQMAIHRKFAIPVACLVFGVIGLALGVTNRRDGALGSFGLGLLVIFAYYVPLFLFPQMAKSGHLPPWLAVWLPNILLGVFAAALLKRRARSADGPISLPVPPFVRRLGTALTAQASVGATASPVRLLDRYVVRSYVRVLALAAAAAVAVFYISTFIDLSDKLFKGNAPWFTLVEYFWYATPQFAYYILPISVLIATLVTIGMLTKSSELTVMKASGVSLYRVAMPMLAGAAIVGAALFVLDATLLGDANRRAEALRDQMRGSASLRPIYQPWVAGADGSIYHVRAYDPANTRFEGLEIFEFGDGVEHLLRRTFAARAVPVVTAGRGTPPAWRLEDGWTRDFRHTGEVRRLEAFTAAHRRLETASYFAEEPPDPRFMSYAQLRGHTERLRSSGLEVLDQEVALSRKVAFPFVTVIMTLIAIPFAVTIGRSGTMAGIGAGVALALVYWGALSISAALGAGGVLAPVLAAWAPNLLFGAGAAYLVFTVRT